MPESHGRFVSCLKIKRMLWFGKVSKLNRENQMKTIEIFAEAVKFASEASDIPSDRILSESRDADVLQMPQFLVLSAIFRHHPRMECGGLHQCLASVRLCRFMV